LMFESDVIGVVVAVSNVITLRGRGGQSERLKRVVTIRSQR
jgi:replication factor A1